MVVGLVLTDLPIAAVAMTHTHPADWSGDGFSF
jgi:hypothetical protein